VWFRSFLKSPKPRPSAAPVRRPAPRPQVEALEDRSLLSCTVSLAPGEAAPQLVGERVTWTATAADCGAAPVYQFSVAPPGGAFQVVRDFSPDGRRLATASGSRSRGEVTIWDATGWGERPKGP